MILELSLMAFGGAGMIALLAHRHFESSRGFRSKVHEVREKADPILHSVHRSTGRLFSHFTLHNFVLFANILFVQVVRIFMLISSRVHRVSSDIVAKASKKTEDLSRGGAASFYLKRIKDGKERKPEASVGTE